MPDPTSFLMMVGGTAAFFGALGWSHVSLSARIDALFMLHAGMPYKEYKRRNGRR